jgi:glucose-1-phosphate cytidylyltransferase
VQTVILAGGRGTRISEETYNKPKPMVTINDKPILQHLMEIYAIQGFSDFKIAIGYRGEVILEWINSLQDLSSRNKTQDTPEDNQFRIEGVDTGLETQTGGRIKRLISERDERIFVTYGDGLANVNLQDLLKFHEASGSLATLTAVRPPARFGYLEIFENKVKVFGEKNQSAAGWINGGYFVLEPQVADYIQGDDEPFETGALPRLTEIGELSAYKHFGFWQPMDTLREQQELNRLALQSPVPWLEGLTR